MNTITTSPSQLISTFIHVGHRNTRHAPCTASARQSRRHMAPGPNSANVPRTWPDPTTKLGFVNSSFPPSRPHPIDCPQATHLSPDKTQLHPIFTLQPSTCSPSASSPAPRRAWRLPALPSVRPDATTAPRARSSLREPRTTSSTASVPVLLSTALSLASSGASCRYSKSPDTSSGQIGMADHGKGD